MDKRKGYKPGSVLAGRVRRALRERGLFCVAREIVFRITRPFSYVRYKALKSNRTFRFEGREYFYFCHWFNMTWRNDRAVEIPIVWEMVRAADPAKVLEVGNVLSHYFPVTHDVLDKYEKEKDVIVEDVVDYRPTKKYELIVSISTLEHVGWDEEPRDPEKVLRALENLTAGLAPGGKLVATLPVGYNPEMDGMIAEGKLAFTKRLCLKKISRDNRWVEAEWEDVRDVKFDRPYYLSNALVIGIIERDDRATNQPAGQTTTRPE